MSSTALRARAAILAFLGHNATLGMIFGAFGTLLPAITATFHVSRGTTALALSIYMLALGLTAPVAGLLVQRVSLRAVMMLGAAASSVAFGLMVWARDIQQILVLFGLAGIGTGLLGIVAPTTLVSRWFVASRGRILGFVTAPVFMLAAPLVVAYLLPAYGLRSAFLTIAIVYLILTPLMFFVIDKPAEAFATAASDPRALPKARTSALGGMQFWLFTLGIMLVGGAGTGFLVHAVSFFVDKGLSLTLAASVYSVYALAGLAGTIMFGWIADRIGPVTTLLFNVAFQAAVWSLLAWVMSVNGLVVLAALIGACLAATNALHGAGLAAQFGVENVARLMGISSLLKIPTFFLTAPLVGYIRDVSGSYQMAYALLVAMLLMSALCFFAVTRIAKAGLPHADATPVPTVG